MIILVTGAGGFVGAALLRRLASTLKTVDRIIATDVAFRDPVPLPGVDYVPGAIDDAEHRLRLLDQPVDCVFHFATVAGVQATDFHFGKRVNLDATLALLEGLSQQNKAARFIYSSSIGVFSRPFPDTIVDETPPTPSWSYGTHKLVCELMIADYARAGLIDGLALRFPGILARDEGSTTMLSAFLTNIFYAAKAGRAFTLPMLPDDATSVMSLRRCLDNVMAAASIPSASLPPQRVCTLPALFVSMRELVRALAQVYGESAIQRISYEPVDAARSLFAGVPILADSARALGLSGDESALDLVRNVIAENPALTPA